MKPPFFTVVIPTHNRVVFLMEAIESVLAQTFKDYELIVVDDHSTDGTKAAVTSLEDPRIRYVLNDRNPGGAGTRNAGIFRSRGAWVAFLDDDDVWLPKKLELHYKKIQEFDNSVGLLYSGSAKYDFTNQSQISISVPEKEGWIQDDLLYKNYLETFSRVSIRADVLKKVGGLDERFEALQDRDLYVRIAGVCKIALIKDTLTLSRRSNTNRITTNTKKRLSGISLFVEKYKYLINSSPRLRHRNASQVFLYSLLEGERKKAVRSLLWTTAGFLIDFPNMILLGRLIYQYFSRKNRVNS